MYVVLTYPDAPAMPRPVDMYPAKEGLYTPRGWNHTAIVRGRVPHLELPKCSRGCDWRHPATLWCGRSLTLALGMSRRPLQAASLDVNPFRFESSQAPNASTSWEVHFLPHLTFVSGTACHPDCSSSNWRLLSVWGPAMPGPSSRDRLPHLGVRHVPMGAAKGWPKQPQPPSPLRGPYAG